MKLWKRVSEQWSKVILELETFLNISKRFQYFTTVNSVNITTIDWNEIHDRFYVFLKRFLNFFPALFQREKIKCPTVVSDILRHYSCLSLQCRPYDAAIRGFPSLALYTEPLNWMFLFLNAFMRRRAVEGMKNIFMGMFLLVLGN